MGAALSSPREDRPKLKPARSSSLRRMYASARATSWLELLQRTNEVMAADYDGLPSMEICSTCRGAPFSPEDLTLGEAS